MQSQVKLAGLQPGAAGRAMASAAKDEKYDFDLFTIGGGTGGVRAARFASSDYGERCQFTYAALSGRANFKLCLPV